LGNKGTLEKKRFQRLVPRWTAASSDTPIVTALMLSKPWLDGISPSSTPTFVLVHK